MLVRTLLVWAVLAVPAWASIPRLEVPLTVSPHAMLSGSTFFGEGVEGPTTYRFDPGGVLWLKYKNQDYKAGTWKQDGRSIYWESNGKYCEFQGTIDGQVITGKAWNVRGGKWTLTFSLQGATRPAKKAK